jgi:hypothetical protein
MKAQADILYLAAYGFAVTLVVVVIIFAWTSLSTSSAWTSLTHSNPDTAHATTSATTAVDYIANAIAIVWILLGIASIIATFFVDTSPVFAVLGMIILPIEVFLGMVFHDFFFILMSETAFAPLVPNLNTLLNFWSVYPLVIFVFAVLSIIFTFAK